MASSPTTEAFDLSTAKLKPGTVAIVTGAAEGLGRGFAEGLLEKGAKGVCLADINESLGRDTTTELGNKFGKDRVMFVKCDVTSASDIEAVFTETRDKFGTINLMVNNAGILNEKDWELCVATNVMGVTRGTYSAIKYMSKGEGGHGGKIINISSNASFILFPFAPIYCGTKHFVSGFTKSLAADPLLAEEGITFGILCPYATNTPVLKKVVYRDQEEGQKGVKEILLKYGVMEIPQVRDAFLQLVIDESWSGKAMLVSKHDGIRAFDTFVDRSS